MVVPWQITCWKIVPYVLQKIGENQKFKMKEDNKKATVAA